MASRLATLLLLALLVIFQGQLWIGRGSVWHVRELEVKLQQQQEKNAQVKQQNEQLRFEVEDLKTGSQLVEAIARQELGMVKPNEIYVQYPK
jgi:cell division protein FtsB